MSTFVSIDMTDDEKKQFIDAMVVIRGIFGYHNLCDETEFREWIDNSMRCLLEVRRYSPESPRVDKFATTIQKIVKELS